MDIARTGERRPGQRRDGDDEVGAAAAAAPAEVEQAVMLLGADDQLVAVDFDLGVFEQLFAALRRNADLRAGADFDVIRTGDSDRREVADLEVARDGRARVFALVVTAGDGGGSGEDDGLGGDLSNENSCLAVLRK